GSEGWATLYYLNGEVPLLCCAKKQLMRLNHRHRKMPTYSLVDLRNPVSSTLPLRITNSGIAQMSGTIAYRVNHTDNQLLVAEQLGVQITKREPPGITVCWHRPVGHADRVVVLTSCTARRCCQQHSCSFKFYTELPINASITLCKFLPAGRNIDQIWTFVRRTWRRCSSYSVDSRALPQVDNQIFDARTGCIIITIIDSMTVFNTDASLPYNHDLFESFIVKKRIKVDGEGTDECQLAAMIVLFEVFSPPIEAFFFIQDGHSIPILDRFAHSDLEHPQPVNWSFCPITNRPPLCVIFQRTIEEYSIEPTIYGGSLPVRVFFKYIVSTHPVNFAGLRAYNGGCITLVCGRLETRRHKHASQIQKNYNQECSVRKNTQTNENYYDCKHNINSIHHPKSNLPTSNEIPGGKIPANPKISTIRYVVANEESLQMSYGDILHRITKAKTRQFDETQNVRDSVKEDHSLRITFKINFECSSSLAVGLRTCRHQSIDITGARSNQLHNCKLVAKLGEQISKHLINYRFHGDRTNMYVRYMATETVTDQTPVKSLYISIIHNRLHEDVVVRNIRTSYSSVMLVGSGFKQRLLSAFIPAVEKGSLGKFLTQGVRLDTHRKSRFLKPDDDDSLRRYIRKTSGDITARFIITSIEEIITYFYMFQKQQKQHSRRAEPPPRGADLGSLDASLGELRVQQLQTGLTTLFGFNVLVTFDNVHHKTSGASAPVPTSTQERFVGLKCEECGKWCKSKAGLVAHHRVHDNDSVDSAKQVVGCRKIMGSVASRNHTAMSQLKSKAAFLCQIQVRNIVNERFSLDSVESLVENNWLQNCHVMRAGSGRYEILPRCSILNKDNGDVTIGLEPLTLWSLKLRLNHLKLSLNMKTANRTTKNLTKSLFLMKCFADSTIVGVQKMFYNQGHGISRSNHLSDLASQVIDMPMSTSESSSRKRSRFFGTCKTLYNSECLSLDLRENVRYSSLRDGRSAVTPSERIAAMTIEGTTREEMLAGCPIFDRRCPDSGVGEKTINKHLYKVCTGKRDSLFRRVIRRRPRRRNNRIEEYTLP
ncbi:hypothetical protein CLF_102893, partial [Clonorchis sinensis]